MLEVVVVVVILQQLDVQVKKFDFCYSSTRNRPELHYWLLLLPPVPSRDLSLFL